MLYPDTWYGIVNNERWDVFPPYFALQRTNVLTGERERTAFIVPPQVGEEYLRRGSVLQRPLEDSVMLIWPDGDEALEYARRASGQSEDPDYDPYSEDQYQDDAEYGPEHGGYYQQQQQADVMYGPYPQNYYEQHGEEHYDPAYDAQMPVHHPQPVIAQLPNVPQHAQQHGSQIVGQQGPFFAVQYIPTNILFGRPPGLEPESRNQYLTWQPPPGMPMVQLPLIDDQKFVTAPPSMYTNFYPATSGQIQQPVYNNPVPSTPPPLIPPNHGKGFAPGYFENQYRSPQDGHQGAVKHQSTRQKSRGKGKTQKGNQGKPPPDDVPLKEDPSAALQSIPVESKDIDIVKEGVAADVTETKLAKAADKDTVEEKISKMKVADKKPETSVAGPSASVHALPASTAFASGSAPTFASASAATACIHASNGSDGSNDGNGSNGGSGSPTSVQSHKTTSSSGKSLRSVLSQKSHKLLCEAAEEASTQAEQEVQAPKGVLLAKKKSVLTPSKTKNQLRRERVQALKAQAAQEAAEFDRILEEQKIKDQQELQKELDAFAPSLEFYVRVLSAHRNKHFALRKNGYGQLRGVQKNIVDFYKDRCVFLTKYEIQDSKVVTFLESKKAGYEKDGNPRLFGMFRQMMEMIATTPIVQQDLFWLFAIRQQSFFKQAVQELYCYILYSRKLKLRPLQMFTAEEVQAHFEGVLTNFGLEPYEGFAEYLNRAVTMRSMRRPIPPDAPTPLCNFEKWITDEHIDFMNIDATWTQERTSRFIKMVGDLMEGEEDIEGCVEFLSHLPTIQSEVIDYDLSKFEAEYPEFLLMHILGYFGLVIGGLTDDDEDWNEDFVMRDF